MVVCCALFAGIQSAGAALPPQYQNHKDLDVMVEFVHSHPVVASGLRTIDLYGYAVYFGDGCKAEFGRKTSLKLPGWVGPADPLEFKSSNCPVE
jgi:hypothetical protein